MKVGTANLAKRSFAILTAVLLLSACARTPAGCQPIRFDGTGSVNFKKAAVEHVEPGRPAWGLDFALIMTLKPDLFHDDPWLATASRYLIEPDFLDGARARCRLNQLGPGAQCFSRIPGTKLLVVVTLPTNDIRDAALAEYAARRIADEAICR